MADALIVPLIALLILAAIGAVYFARAARRQAAIDETLPDDPYARREEEVRRLEQAHAEARPWRTRHPARRP